MTGAAWEERRCGARAVECVLTLACRRPSRQVAQLDCSCFNGTYVTELGADYFTNLAKTRTFDRGDATKLSSSNLLDTLQAAAAAAVVAVVVGSSSRSALLPHRAPHRVLFISCLVGGGGGAAAAARPRPLRAADGV